jgi:N-acetylmuramoyl-L-alanine amidase
VQKAGRLVIFLALAAAVGAFASDANGILWPTSARSLAVSSQQSPSLPATPPTPQQPPQPSAQALPTVVLDPAHGGTDEGAHGSGGILEKDIVLTLAQTVASQLEQNGMRVVMTRQSDQTLSFEQRAALANAQSNAIFIALHVGSTGTMGTAYVYYFDFSQVVGNQPETAASGWVRWDHAQSRWQSLSQRLAQLVQVEISERLRGSPELPQAAPVFQLREISEPAIAIEVENVDASSAAALDALGAPLAEAISRAIQAFRTIYPAGTS